MHITKISPKINDIGLTNQIKSQSSLCTSQQPWQMQMLSWRKIRIGSHVQFNSDNVVYCIQLCRVLVHRYQIISPICERGSWLYDHTGSISLVRSCQRQNAYILVFPSPQPAFPPLGYTIQEAQLMQTTGMMRLVVSQGQQTWYHFGSVATFP